MARPKVFAGTTVGVKLTSILDIKIRGEAAKEGRSVSEVVRERLERSYGEGHEASADKN